MKQQLRLPFFINECRYLFLAPPDIKLASRLMTEKKTFSLDFNYEFASNCYPHITIAYFDADESLETSLVQLLHQACSKYQQFSAGLFGYDGFKSSDNSTIYIKVKEQERFLHLANNLGIINNLLKSNGFRSANLVNNPHLTIARGLPYLIYLRALEKYCNRSFRDTFLVNDLLLLKKKNGDKHYQQIINIRLSPPNSFLN